MPSRGVALQDGGYGRRQDEMRLRTRQRSSKSLRRRSALRSYDGRDGVEPDMAFTGASDTVPWVVWYEQNPSTVGLNGNELVFAAKAK